VPEITSVFKRTEKKYLITRRQKEELAVEMQNRMTPDEFGRSIVCSIYFDTPDYRYIRASIEKPVYKEKLRMRCYGRPDENSRVFIELKKKFKGVVYKRRETLTLSQAKDYVERGIMPCNTQIMREIDYVYHLGAGLRPTALIMCEREAFFASDDRDFRVTFDGALRFRTTDVFPDGSLEGEPIVDSDIFVMEIKSAGGMPLWLSAALDKMKLYPVSFSKYGRVYTDHISRKEYTYA